MNYSFRTLNPGCCNLKEGIERRTEDYIPSCAELTNKIPVIVKGENDYFFVHSKQNYLYVFGVNIEPKQPPQIHWWGANSENMLKECLDK